MWGRAFLAGVFTLTIVYITAAQEVRAPAIGTRLVTTTGGYFEIAGTESLDVVTRNASGQSYRWIGGFMHRIGQASDSQLAEIRSLHPLAVGRSVSFDTAGVTARGSNAAYNHRIRVLKQEQVVVAAGTFQTFVIEWRERNISQLGSRPDSSAEFIRTYWYAPEIGFIVKFEYREQGSTVPQSISPWEIKEIDARRASTPVPAQTTTAPRPTTPPATSSSSSGAAPTEIARRLQDLQLLRERGLITEEEWKAKRKAILDSL